ncbi:MAG: DUF2304 domain-containing protein [Ignavibacteriae bacterium]|nr:DUF2304 domain-containing protein [Ignavibacteriota bacterium]
MNNFNIDKIQYFAIAGSVLFLIFVILLVRNKKIKEEYSILWFIFGIIFLVISVWREILIQFSNLIGIAYPPVAFILILIFAIFLILIQYSVVISNLKEKNKDLVQRLGLLENEMKKKEKRAE